MHDLATQLIANDVDLIIVQALIGHANIGTLIHYVKSEVPRKRAGVEKLPDSGAGEASAMVAMPALQALPATPKPIHYGTCWWCRETFSISATCSGKQFCEVACGRATAEHSAGRQTERLSI